MSEVGYRDPASATAVEIGVVHDWETYVYFGFAVVGAAIAIVAAAVARRSNILGALLVEPVFVGYVWLQRGGNLWLRYRVLVAADEITVVSETWILPSKRASARITRASRIEYEDAGIDAHEQVVVVEDGRRTTLATAASQSCSEIKRLLVDAIQRT